MRALGADDAMRSLTVGGLGNRMDVLVPMGEDARAEMRPRCARRDVFPMRSFPMDADVDVALAGPGEPLRWGT